MGFKKGNTFSKNRIPWNKGKKLSKEHKEKIRNSEKGRIFTEEHKKKLSSACKGRIISTECRKKISDTLTGKPLSEDTKRKISRRKKGIYPTHLKKYKDKNGAWNKGLNGKEYMSHYPNGICASGINCDTKPERLFENQLLFNNILYVKQYRYDLGFADFWLPEQNIIVEVDGIYWHSRPEAIKRDKRQNEWLKQNYYEVYRFTDKEILNDVKACVKEVLQ